jgi:hypothetical protein
LDQSSRDFLEDAIQDYNDLFGTSFDTSADRFGDYYRDLSLRLRNRDLDLVIVVNMFLTGFDATTLNTLWADKNLKAHGLIQAYSRTNRILNSVNLWQRRSAIWRRKPTTRWLCLATDAQVVKVSLYGSTGDDAERSPTCSRATRQAS